MKTAVTKRGQTVVPAAIRKRYRIDQSVHLVWLDDGETIKVIPVTDNPLQSLRGRGREKKNNDGTVVEGTPKEPRS